MAKSAEFTAWRPSRPQMPTPTCASWIIGTSLAPSPTAKVTGVGLTFLLTSWTICAFCKGETRQAMTTEQRWAMPKKSSSALEPSTFSSACPVTMRPQTTAPEAAFSARGSKACIFFCRSLLSSPCSMSRIMTSISSVSTRVLKPMFRAVSSLSPVSTHNFTPPLRKRTMVFATPICSLSSMAVAPSSSNLVSIFSATADSAPSRSSIATCAFSYSLCHAATSWSGSFRRPMTRVRRPSRENSVN
mmetsp:Transcript_100682/g.280415  ORF Transcript_100682/g.280415 Transcript_100682/m.280415 type:complete len:245 (+) Transcript_100682:1008-1742(+)